MSERTVTLPTPSGDMDCFVVEPEGSAPAAGVVVLQEAYGVNHDTKEKARLLAREGYRAIAPELYHRSVRGLDAAYDFALVQPHFGKVTNEGLTEDLAACAQWLSAQPGARGGAGVVGFCMGGFGAFLGALLPGYACAVSCYGGGLTRERPGVGMKPLLPRAAELKAPVLCLYGGKDQSITESDIAQTRDALAAHGKPGSEVIVYADAGHAFLNADRPNMYCEGPAREGWAATLAFLRKHLA